MRRLHRSALAARGVQKWAFKREYLYAPFLWVVLAQRALLCGAYTYRSITLWAWRAHDCSFCVSGQLRSSICKQGPLLSTSKQGEISSAPILQTIQIEEFNEADPYCEKTGATLAHFIL